MKRRLFSQTLLTLPPVLALSAEAAALPELDGFDDLRETLRKDPEAVLYLVTMAESPEKSHIMKSIFFVCEGDGYRFTHGLEWPEGSKSSYRPNTLVSKAWQIQEGKPKPSNDELLSFTWSEFLTGNPNPCVWHCWIDRQTPKGALQFERLCNRVQGQKLPVAVRGFQHMVDAEIWNRTPAGWSLSARHYPRRGPEPLDLLA